MRKLEFEDQFDQRILLYTLKDKILMNWVYSQAGKTSVEIALDNLKHNTADRRKPYPSNIVRMLGLVPPKHLYVTPPEEAKKRLMDIKHMLASLG